MTTTNEPSESAQHEQDWSYGRSKIDSTTNTTAAATDGGIGRELVDERNVEVIIEWLNWIGLDTLAPELETLGGAWDKEPSTKASSPETLRFSIGVHEPSKAPGFPD
jgi:hypothetical protein